MLRLWQSLQGCCQFQATQTCPHWRKPTALPVPIVEEEEDDDDDDYVDPGQEEEYRPIEYRPTEEEEGEEDGVVDDEAANEDSDEEGDLEIVTEGPDDSGVSSSGTGL